MLVGPDTRHPEFAFGPVAQPTTYTGRPPNAIGSRICTSLCSLRVTEGTLALAGRKQQIRS